MGSNGIISINGTMDQQQSFNLGAWPAYDWGVSFIAPFWADSNTFHQGNMKCRESTAQNELNTVVQAVRDAPGNLIPNGFRADFLFVADWIDVSPCGCFFPVSILFSNSLLPLPLFSHFSSFFFSSCWCFLPVGTLFCNNFVI